MTSLPAPEPASAADLRTCTVASFNTHWGVTLRGAPFPALETCVALDADVLALQEAWHPRGEPGLAALVAAHTGATVLERPLMSDRNPARPRHLPPRDGAPGTCGIAIVTRLPVLERFDVDLGHAPGDVVTRRWGLCVTVALPDGSPVTFAAVHASHRLWGSLPQLARLDRALRDRALPSAILGDCNMWGPPVATVLRGRRRAVRGRTWPAWRPHSQIDHAWVDDRWDVLDHEVLPDAGSDHRPIRAVLRLRGTVGS